MSASIERMEPRRLMSVTVIKDAAFDQYTGDRPAQQFVISNGVAYFTRIGFEARGALYRTDGITATLVKQEGIDDVGNLRAMPFGVMMTHSGGAQSRLWRSDGTTAGTFEVPGEFDCVHYDVGTVDSPVAIDGNYYVDSEGGGCILYASAGGAVQQIGLLPSGVDRMVRYSHGAIFGTLHGIYSVDPQNNVTNAIPSTSLGGDHPNTPYNVGASLVFDSRTSDLSGYGPIRTMDLNLQHVRTLSLQNLASPEYQWVVGSDGKRALVDAAYGDGTSSLYATDGTHSTLLVKHGSIDAESVVGRIGDQTYFVASALSGEQLWVTDGTAHGTHFVSDESSQSQHVIYRGEMYFLNTDAAHGTEIWKTDGTRQGTHLAVDVLPGSASSNPKLDGVINDRLIFNGRLNEQSDPTLLAYRPDGEGLTVGGTTGASIDGSMTSISRNDSSSDAVDALFANPAL
jgi:ELWxxDGT repeat protein